MTGFGVSIAAPADAPNYVDSVLQQATDAAAAGIRTVWVGQRFDYDAITLATVVGREVPGITVGTAAIPVFGRHPLSVLAAAQTAQAATGGRFALGLALGAPELLARGFGLEHDRPIGMLREFLAVLNEAQATGSIDFHGERITAAPPWPVNLAGASPAPLLIAAMGPQALRVAGELASGILPFLAGPRVLAEQIVPTVTKAAAEAGRDEPRVHAFMMGVVTDDVDAARATAHAELGRYDSIPSYRRVLDLEGLERAADLAVIGDEEFVAARIKEHIDAGATDIVFTRSHVLGDADRLRTYRLLGELARS